MHKFIRCDILFMEKGGGQMAPISEARKRANKKWNDAHMKERYDRVQLVLPKGRKEDLQAIAERHGQSVNAFMISLLDAALEREATSNDG